MYFLLSSALIVLVALQIGCAETKTPTAQAASFRVEHRGAMREMFASGDISGKIPVAEWTAKPNVYALAPLENLRGEVTVFDGKAFVSAIENQKPAAIETKDAKAIFGVWAEVSGWKEIEIPANVKSYSELENFIVQAAKNEKIDVSQPFPFLLKGKAARVAWHINNYQNDAAKVTREIHDAAKFRGESENQEFRFVGFYSDKHQGVFIHHTAKTHIHSIAEDGITAHVDDLTLNGTMKLFLPF